MKRVFLITILAGILTSGFAQQISISRIESMPNKPTPYLMRNWKQVALDYDNFIFDPAKTGTHLPLVSFRTSGVNYSDIQSIELDTYVGQDNHGDIAEAINILPAIIGASLVGVDKTTHLNINWVAKIKDFFNSANGQNVYLNNYSASTGDDWWYELMPSVFFYQLYSLYPDADADFAKQYTMIADRELEMVEKLGGNTYNWSVPSMNYRAFNLLTGEPETSGVAEPEAAGAVAWLLYQAYRRTGELKYRYGAELSLGFLQDWESNPSYEIQLPYGIHTAARMNAIEGTDYDIEKFLNWTFSFGANTLRGWGTIAGRWGGYDVSGLIGEANDDGNDYAFVMNGFQHAAALAPVAKYDKRFARLIAKWMLNIANASRLFYRPYLSESNQENASYAWSSQYDPDACIPYESMRESYNSASPFAMGDAVTKGWASTNLSLYSGSGVGYLAAVTDTTNVSGILQIDVNKTDFDAENTYPTYLYYNPNPVSETVSLNLPTGNFDIYDMISDDLLASNARENMSLVIPPDSVVMPVLVPAGSPVDIDGRIFKVLNGGVIDYHYHYNYTNELRIKAFVADTNLVTSSGNVHFKCYTGNSTGTVNYNFFVNGSSYASGMVDTFTWTAPDSTGIYQMFCKVSDSNDTLVSDTLNIRVVSSSAIAPVIDSLVISGSDPYDISSQLSIAAYTNNAPAAILWEYSGGTLENASSLSPVWNIPASEGIYSLTLTLTNDLGTTTKTKQILVKNLSAETTATPLIYYPFSGNTENAVQDKYDAVSVNAELTEDALGNAGSAYQFTSGSQYIYTANDNALNFTDKVAVSLWVKPKYLTSGEQFIISHGSWEERYKLSVTSEGKARWTVKTNESTVDVDDPEILSANTFVHYTVQYTGYSLEMYRNGSLAAYAKLSGKIGTTDNAITMARKDKSTADYNFRGTIDEVYIFDTDLSVSQIKDLPYSNLTSVPIINMQDFDIYPNPFNQRFYIELPDNESIDRIWMLNLQGRVVWSAQEIETDVPIYPKIYTHGLYFVKIRGKSGNLYFAEILKI